jgi:polyhydroxyalkanoate synthase
MVSSTDKRLMRFHTGHVGLIASSYSQNNVLPKVGQWLKERSQ